jgi:C-terminal processing protease CtpA/Prc
VIAGFYADSAGIAVGDVVLKVDGQDAQARMDGIVKYISASTPQALMWKLMERFMNGPDNSTAVLTLRDGSGQVKEVKVTRSRGYWPARFEQRSGEIVKRLPGNIGYADLIACGFRWLMLCLSSSKIPRRLSSTCAVIPMTPHRTSHRA